MKSVFFVISPEQDILDYLIPLIDDAKERVWFTSYIASFPLIIGALTRAHKRGLDVYGLMESTYSANLTTMKHFVKVGMDIRWMRHTGHRLHGKLFIIDDIIVLTTSNMTHDGLRNNYEFTLAFRDVKILRQLEKWFLALYADSKGNHYD